MGIITLLFTFVKGLSPRTLMIIVGVIAILAALAYIKHLGYKECEADLIKSNSNAQEKFNEIANNRPDNDALIKLLQSGKY